MSKQILPFLIAIALSSTALAQTLYMPRDVTAAFGKQSREADGKPGKNYWQNHARYAIEVTALPPNRTIKGSEDITYFNNSPDTLKTLNIKLIINIHRPGAVWGRFETPDYITEGMQIDNFSSGNYQINWDNKKAAGTNQEVKLKTPLPPHDSLKLHINWHYEVSLKSDREGMIDSTTFYLAYFYPRISVYDDYNGWDRLVFNDRTEFYNDFNDYTLKVTVPKNFIVWATGTLQNPDEVLQHEIAKRLKASFVSDSVLHIATQAEVASQKVTRQNPTNTWIWAATNISDMAVGIGNHYVWDAASVVVDDATGRRASMQAAFADTAADFHHAVAFGCNTLGWLSHNWPGIPYPFPKMTAFQGFADMEYPMMVNDGHEKELHTAQFLQDHEIAHTYFPFYMGINETRYGFMDEGWATTFELLIGTAEVGKAEAEKGYKAFRINTYIHDPSSYEDLPVIIPSSELYSANSHNEYGKPSLSYLALKDMLGDTLFKKCLHDYINRWNGKHPIPWDYFNTMSNASGRDLTWFFYNWFYTYNYIDLAIKSVTKTPAGYKILVNNVGGFAVPFDAIIAYADGTSATIHQTPAVWQADQKSMIIILNSDKIISSVKIDGGIFMDANEKDNVWVAK